MNKKSSSSSTSGLGQKRKVDNSNSKGKASSSKKPKETQRLIPYSSVQTLVRHEKAYDYYEEREIELHFNERYGEKSFGVSVQNLKENSYYSIERIKNKCKRGSKCELYCEDCGYCRHQFECECGDEYMCEHVHRLCGALSSDDESTSDNSESSDSDSSDESGDDNNEEDEDKEESELKQDELSALFSECRSLVSDEKGEKILRENLNTVLIQLRAHGQKLKK